MMTDQPRSVFRFGTFILAALALCGILASCTTVSVPPSADVLRVGVTANYRPLVYKENGKLVGLEVDMAKALAADLGCKAVFIEMPWHSLIPAIEKDKIDIIMSGMSITPGREVRMVFSKPYLKVGQTALVRAESAARYDAPQLVMITRAPIAVVKGTTGDIFVQQNCLNANRISYSSPAQCGKALTGGKVDIVIHDSPVIWELAAQLEDQGVGVLPFKFTDEGLAWAMRRSNMELVNQVNAVQKEWVASGRMKQFIDHWFAWLKK